MTTMLAVDGVMEMGRSPSDEPSTDGTTLRRVLIDLGWSEEVVRITDVANAVTEKTGRNLSRQRLSVLLNTERIRDATLEHIAKGLGTTVDVLRGRKPARKPKG
jgi:hypothetical protein